MSSFLLGLMMAFAIATPGHVAYAQNNALDAQPPGTAGEPKVVTRGTCAEVALLYEDFAVGDSIYEQTLIDLDWCYTFVDNGDDFLAELSTGAYSHVISSHQNAADVQGFEAELLDWILANPNRSVILGDWRTGDPAGYLGALGFSFGSSNTVEVIPVAEEVFDGLADATLENPGWSVYSYDVDGGTPQALSETDQPKVARIGTVFFNGFLSDTFADEDLGVAYITRQLLAGDQSPPGPGPGAPTSAIGVPTTSLAGLAVLILLLAGFGVWQARALRS